MFYVICTQYDKSDALGSLSVRAYCYGHDNYRYDIGRDSSG